MRPPAEALCICCPTGCRLRLRREEGSVAVEGAGCERGREYAQVELVTPQRTFTGTVRVSGGRKRVVPVRCDGPVPKQALLEVARRAAGVCIPAPIVRGQRLAEDVLPGIALVATAVVDAV